MGRCEALGTYTAQSLRRFPTRFATTSEAAARLVALAETAERATAALGGSQAAYREAVLALVGARVDLKLVDLAADELVRSVKRGADEAGKDVSLALFPNGVTPVVRPFGDTEAKELRALEGRIAAATRFADRATHAARVEAVRTAYEGALAARREGMVTAASKRALRDAAKEDFLDALAAIAGAVREIFPRDRPRQDVFFDEVSARRATTQEAEDPGADES